MILYVSVTAVLNIALGFALAMYLYRAGMLGAPRPALAAEDAHHVEEVPHEPIPHEPVAHSEPSPVAPLPAPAVQEPIAAASAPIAEEPETAEAVPGPELEENVLAGIEEFRNQLAQMKAQPAEAGDAAHA